MSDLIPVSFSVLLRIPVPLPGWISFCFFYALFFAPFVDYARGIPKGAKPFGGVQGRCP